MLDNLISNINKHIVLPLYMRKSRNDVLCRSKELVRSQYYSVVQIHQIQLQQLNKLLHHAYKNVPFYKDRFDSVGFKPDDMNSIQDIERIPYLTKSDVQNNLEKLIARNYESKFLLADASGGSTGKPTIFYKDLYRHQIRRADQIRHDQWTGWDIGEKYVTLWGAQRGNLIQRIPLKTKILEKYIYRVYGFNAFDISEQKVVDYIHELRKIKPTMILAYANVAYLFARIIINKRIYGLGRIKY